MKKSLILVMMMAVAQVYAATINDVSVDAWAESSLGANENSVGMFIDFGGGNTTTIGYRWNAVDVVTRPANPHFAGPVGAELAEALILSAEAQTALAPSYTYWAGLGMSVSELNYAGENIGTGGYPVDYTGLWTSNDGANWTFAMSGVTGLDLSTVAWLGWSRRTSDAFPAPASEAPSAVAIPEPASVALLGLAGLLMIRRRSC